MDKGLPYVCSMEFYSTVKKKMTCIYVGIHIEARKLEKIMRG